MNDVVVLSALRTPVGRLGGALAGAVIGGVVIFATPLLSTVTVGLVGWYWVVRVDHRGLWPAPPDRWLTRRAHTPPGGRRLPPRGSGA